MCGSGPHRHTAYCRDTTLFVRYEEERQEDAVLNEGKRDYVM